MKPINASNNFGNFNKSKDRLPEFDKLSDLVKNTQDSGNSKNKNQKNHQKSQLERIENYLSENYELRYNIVLNEVEYRSENSDSDDDFQTLKAANIYRELEKKHFKIAPSKLDILLQSDYVEEFDPFIDFFEKLPKWNPDTDPDYIEKYANYVKAKDQKRFNHHFKKHLVRTIVCALGKNYFNKHAFIIVGKRQNSGKSTWCRKIVPPKLGTYYTENFGTDKDGLIALSENLIINLDELATLDRQDLKKLKSIISMEKIKVRHPFGKKAIVTPRRASFFGSTNEYNFLNDETGSVRWLCFEIYSIDWSYTNENIDLIWSQAYYLYKSGKFEYQLTNEEIKENEYFNQQFQKSSPEKDLIQMYFLPGNKVEHDAFYTATDVLRLIYEKADKNVRMNYVSVGKALTALGFEKTSKRLNKNSNPITGYYVKFTECENYENPVLKLNENILETPNTNVGNDQSF